MKYYAVRKGRQTGIFTDWDACSKSVTGYAGAQFKSFKSLKDADRYASGPGGTGGRVGSSGAIGSSIGTSLDYSTVSPLTRKRGVRGYSNAISKAQRKPSRSLTTLKPLAASKLVTKPLTTSKPLAVSKPLTAVVSHMIYTDGASKGNQNQSTAVAGYGVYFGPKDERNVAEPLASGRQTNQRAELTAIKVALEVILTENSSTTRYDISTDSSYSIKCLTKWAVNWQRNGWKNTKKQPVENQDIIRPCLNLLEQVNSRYRENGWDQLQFFHVPGHAGIPGNEMADRLANEGCFKALAQ